MRHLVLLAALFAASPAAAQAPEAPAEAPAQAGFLAEIQGTWTVSLTEQQARDIEIMRLALSEKPPKKKALQKMGLTEEETLMFGFLAAMIQEMDKDDPDLAMMRKVAAGADHATIAFADGQLTRAVPGLQMSVPYEVVADAADATTVRFAQEEATKEWTMTRDGDGLVVTGEGESPMRYTRVNP